MLDIILAHPLTWVYLACLVASAVVAFLVRPRDRRAGVPKAAVLVTRQGDGPPSSPAARERS